MDSEDINVSEFEKRFELLSKNHKKIFKFIHWYSCKYKNVFVSVITISKYVKCSPSTVKRATAHFNKMNWVKKSKRSHKSNLYFMNEKLLNLDIENLDKPIKYQYKKRKRIIEVNGIYQKIKKDNNLLFDYKNIINYVNFSTYIPMYRTGKVI